MLLLLTGLVAADPPDGRPGMSGGWLGKLKVKSWDLHASDDDQSKARAPVHIQVDQELFGDDVTMTLYVPDEGGSRAFGLTGKVGNYRVWAVRREPGEVIMLTGRLIPVGSIAAHVLGLGKFKLKGRLLVAEDFTVTEAKFVAREREVLTPEVVPGTPGGSADGEPSIAGRWTGTCRFRENLQYEPPDYKDRSKWKDAVTLDFVQDGGNVDLTMSLLGGDVIQLAGECGNGHFWAIGDHPQGGPTMVIGHRKKGTAKGVGIMALAEAVRIFKFKVKQTP
jgi:hypothetical protein